MKLVVTLVPLTMPSNNEKRTFSSDNDTSLLGLVTEIMKNVFPPLFKVIAVKRDLFHVFFFFLLVLTALLGKYLRDF